MLHERVLSLERLFAMESCSNNQTAAFAVFILSGSG